MKKVYIKVMMSLLIIFSANLNAQINDNKRYSTQESIKILNQAIIKLIQENEQLHLLVNQLSTRVNTLEETFNTKKNIEDENIKDCYFVNTWKLNIRSLPNGSSKIVATKRIGEKVNVEAYYGQWAKLKNERYVNTKYIKKCNEVTLTSTMHFNLRKQPYESVETLIASYPSGITFSSIGQYKKWYILDDGTFVHQMYVNKR